MKDMTIGLTTNGSGAVTQNGETSIHGLLEAIEYIPGSMDTGATVTITCEGAQSKALLTLTNAGTSNRMIYPRDLVHGVTDGVALTGTAGGDRTKPLLAGLPKVVVASGGGGKTGKVVLHFHEED